jgi:hypothetical protein
MSRGILVLDFEFSEFWENRLLDHAVARKYAGTAMFALLADRAREAGWEALTADVFLRQRPKRARAFVVTDGYTRFTRRLARAGVDLAVLLSGESPAVIPWFYHRLAAYTAPYRHALLFRGFSGRVAPRVRFHPLAWPFDDTRLRAGPPFAARRLLVMVAAHKRRFPVDLTRPVRSLLANGARYGRWQYYRAVDPLFRFPDHYMTRLRAVEHFASSTDFELFGAGWDQLGLPGFRPRFVHAPRPCGDKRETMARFRFSLAFENCGFPGYVTEKIFDAFLAGTVPVYCGAPDVADFCPKDCFIDVANYGSFDELQRALRDFDERAWSRKREAIDDFLASSVFAAHHAHRVADDLWNWITA